MQMRDGRHVVTVPADALTGDRLAARLSQRRPGEHLWVVTVHVELDLQHAGDMLGGEALALEGPGCYCCGRSIRQAAPRCPA